MSLFAKTAHRISTVVQCCSVTIVLIFFATLSSARANPVEQLRTLINEVPLSKVPGIILLIEGPELRFHEARGYANRKTKKPIHIDYSLRTGSICKTYVAALSIMAKNEGLIDLDSSIDHYLNPDILNQLPSGLQPTVRQLLNHTSGVPDYYGLRFYLQDWKKTEPLTTELVLHAIRGKKATIKPGERFSYSNTNYHLLALILEDVYQKPLATLFRERIFEPLGLEATYYDQHFPPGDEIHGYGSPLRPWNDTYDWRENSGPDGGMIASAADLAIWIRTLFSPEGLFFDIGTAMSANPVADGERVFQSMGVEILQSRSGVKIMGHTGSVDGYLTAAFYVKANDTVMVLHINKSDSRTFNSILSKTLKIILNE